MKVPIDPIADIILIIKFLLNILSIVQRFIIKNNKIENHPEGW